MVRHTPDAVGVIMWRKVRAVIDVDWITQGKEREIIDVP
jgi:hypothetical protein